MSSLQRVPRALITGITGQDGQHLAEFLHGKGYEVFGLMKGQNNPKVETLLAEFPFIRLVSGDLTDFSSLVAALRTVEPNEVYNLGAISFVAMSFNQAELTSNVTGLGVLRMLEAIRLVGGSNNNPIRFYQASSSEMYGQVREIPQTELTAFHPRSPYGVAKVFGHHMTVNYRESYGLHASSGILFNHEGPRRGYEFVTRKISHSVARIKLGLEDKLLLGNLAAKRDLCRAALFLCTRPLFTSESTSEPAVFTAPVASVLLPEATASTALRIAERERERRVMLRARCLTACRAAFSADLVLAT